MKKLLSTILASTMILSAATMATAQETFTEQSTQTLAYGTVEAGGSTLSPVSENFEGQEGDWYGEAYFGATADDGFNEEALGLYGNDLAFVYEYRGSGGAVTIPSTFGGALVRGFALIGDLEITSLIIPDTALEYVVEVKSIDTLYLPRALEYANIYAETISTVYYEGTEAEFNSRTEVQVQRDTPEPTIIYNATMPSGTTTGTTTPSTPESSSYPDWATSFVDFVSGDIMPDISTSNFNDASNRGLIAQSFYNMFANGTELVPSHSFTDVGDFGTAVTWCHGAGIMSGTGETTFGTYGNVNREQFCLILKQMATVLEKDTASGDVSSLSDFSDSWSISEWAKEGVAWATANGLMAGNNGALNPQGDVTRLEVAIMLSAFDQL